ncbi:solute carrier family 5 (sodium-coupled monocarboxylate transporter), member 8/12 [Singulisphaera sp. GP187]|uniref:sodium:solute symporter family transporter n=1 Tax=Singulisphaera sp. GP187 TaxID=1882752 RepID=UPI00092717A2|nr:sodium/solute symporter [Singulisphaera sp. GP187]SIO41032.1 solute carrier family 5 (sodium-coupled monocarboxylate transporter), member 8/12 [Singulisphaera sp. GP187]
MLHFSWIDYTVFGGYLLLTLTIGGMFFREKSNLSEYFLAQRSMGSVIVAMTILASLFSGISFLAAPSEGYAYGLTFYIVNFSFFIATPITTLLFLPFFYQKQFFTAYQYLESRFSVQVRTLASASFIVRVLLWLALATYAPALALEQVTGLPLWFTILCTGVLTTFYTTLGGMKAVIWTDVMQLVVLFLGQVIIALTAVSRVPGGFGHVLELAQSSGKMQVSTSLDPTVRLTLWGLLIGATFMNLVQMATDQVSVQRYLTAKSLKEAQRGLWFKLCLVLPVTAVFYGTGVILYAFYQVHGDPLAAGYIRKPDQILPYFVVTELPIGFPGLFIAAIYAASMSTISAGINSLTSASLVDFYQRLWPHPNPDEQVQLRLARYLTLIYGALVIGLAFLMPYLGTLLEASNSIIGLVGGPMLGLFCLGILVRRTTAQGALIGWAAGLGALIPICFLTKISFLWYAMIGCLTTMLIGYLASLLEPAPLPEKLIGLTWNDRTSPQTETQDFNHK